MNISYNWLKQYLDFNLSPEETADKLTLLGLEVEDIQTIGSDYEGFVVGEVLSVRSHPNADRLYLCDVNLGNENESVQIVCGADNVAAGQKVPVATVGSTLPVAMDDGSYLTIKKAKLRGETSQGMICAEDELGLGDDHSGIMVLDNAINTGTPLKNALDLEKDTVFEIGLTPNRPDAACHIGVARDLAAVLELDLKNPYKEIDQPAGDLSDEITIKIVDSEKCHRYTGLIVDNIKVSESPQWLKNRLIAIGLRPINNVVDVTNFVLHEIGQPLHAFDYNLIGDKKIEVKSYDSDIKFVTLDDVERTVPAGSLFICDGNGPVAVAGVMGGEDSEVRNETTKILIESAYFDPSSIRKTSKSLALQTDSSYRFERGIDPNLQLKAAYRAAELIADLAGGTILNGHVDAHEVKTDPLKIDLRVSRINHLLGTSLKKENASSILSRLKIENTEKDNDTLTCTVPTFRPDITREVDLIEEVGRVYDYNNIPRPDSSPFIAPENLSELEIFQQRLKSIAKTLQYKEISTNSLLSKKEADLLADEYLQIVTINPVSQENTTLRTHLMGGFLKVLSYNLNRNARKLRFFELGHVFRKNKSGGTWIEGVDEHIHLLLGLCGTAKEDDWSGAAKPFTVFDLKSDVEAILEELNIADSVSRIADGNKALQYSLNKTVIATITRTDSKTLKGFDVEKEAFFAEFDVTALYNLGFGKQSVTYKPVAKFPTFEFDAAFIVDQAVRTGEMTDIIKKTTGKKLQAVSVFDVYEGKNLGENKKSIAFRLTFLDSNKTLTIKDVEPIVQKVVQVLKKKLGAELRS